MGRELLSPNHKDNSVSADRLSEEFKGQITVLGEKGETDTRVLLLSHSYLHPMRPGEDRLIFTATNGAFRISPQDIPDPETRSRLFRHDLNIDMRLQGISGEFDGQDFTLAIPEAESWEAETFVFSTTGPREKTPTKPGADGTLRPVIDEVFTNTATQIKEDAKKFMQQVNAGHWSVVSYPPKGMSVIPPEKSS